MTITITTFARGGTFHVQGAAIAALATRLGTFASFGGVRIIESPRASIDNSERLDSGEAEFGFVAANLIGRALRGEPPFKTPIALRTVAPANVGPVFFVAPVRSDLRTIDDLRGKRVAVGPPRNAMGGNVAAILRAAGHSMDDITPLYLDFPDGAQALIDGRADAQVHPPVPNEVVTALADAMDIRVLDYAPGQLDRVLRELPLFRRTIMRRSALRGLDADSEQLGVFNLITTHARVADDKVHAMADLMARHAGELAAMTPLFEGLPALFAALGRTADTALQVDGVMPHPGALAAYRNLGREQ